MNRARRNIHRPARNLLQERQDYNSLDQKYRSLETEYKTFKRRASREFEDMKHLYIAETQRLNKIIQQQSKELITDLSFQRPRTEQQYRDASIASLSRLLVTTFNVEKLAEKLNKRNHQQDKPSEAIQRNSPRKRETNSSMSFTYKSITTFLPTSPKLQRFKPIGGQSQNKPPSQGISEKKATKVLSNIRKQLLWHHGKQKSRLS